MSEDEFTIGDTKYVAVQTRAASSCVGCAFRSNEELCHSVPVPCSDKVRQDKRNVVFQVQIHEQSS